MPILCSIETQRTSLRSPSAPSSFTRNLGTMNSEMPLVPAGASGVRASTRWMMFSARSCSPKRDEDLGAGDQVGAVALRDRLGGAQAHVGAGLRLGQVHGAGPLAGDQLAEVGLLLLLGAPGLEALDGAGGQSGGHGERAVGRGLELGGAGEHGLGEPGAAVLHLGVQALPARRRRTWRRRVLEGRRGGHALRAPDQALAVTDGVGGGEDLLHEPSLLLEHRGHGLGIGVA